MTHRERRAVSGERWSERNQIGGGRQAARMSSDRFATMRAGGQRPFRQEERSMNPFARDLDRNAANYVPLTPVSFLARLAKPADRR